LAKKFESEKFRKKRVFRKKPPKRLQDTGSLFRSHHNSPAKILKNVSRGLQDTGSKLQNTGSKLQDTGSKLQDTGSPLQNTGSPHPLKIPCRNVSTMK